MGITDYRFEQLMRTLTFSHNPDEDEQIKDYINAVNMSLVNAITPGDTLYADESMIKSYHRNLTGKLKIKRKSRLIGNECKRLQQTF